MSCKGQVTQGSAVGGVIICTCTCHNPDEREPFLNKLFEASAWRTVDRVTKETLFWRSEAEARAYAKTREPACENCNGTGAVPAGGWESEDEVDSGYVQCPTCAAGVADAGLGDVQDVDPDVEPAQPVRWPTSTMPDGHSSTGEGRTDRVSDLSRDPVGDRNHHLTDEGSERLRTWAKERQEV